MTLRACFTCNNGTLLERYANSMRAASDWIVAREVELHSQHVRSWSVELRAPRAGVAIARIAV